MNNKNLLLIGIALFVLLAILAAAGYFFFLATNATEEKSENKNNQNCSFEIKEVYLEESEYPDSPLLKIRGIVGPDGFYKYIIYFPPQEKTAQGIGPIEVGGNVSCSKEECKPLNPCQEFITQDFIARSYPDNVPEYGVKYFAKIIFYLNNKTEKIWEGEVDWKASQQGEKKNQNETEKRGAVTAPQTTATGQAVVSFPARPNMSSWEQELQNEWVPSFIANIIWGYRVYVNDNFYGDFPAVYTPVGANAYVLTDPQSITLSNLSPGTYYVKIFPLAMYYSPNLVDNYGRRYAFNKTGPSIFLWAWVDRNGNPTSSWQPLSEIPKDYQENIGINYPGYYLIHNTVFSDYVQVKKSSGGGGGGGGLIQ